MTESLKGPDYERHCWRKEEIFREVIKCAGIVAALSLYFYRSMWAVIPLCGLGIRCLQMDAKKKAKEDRHMLLLQFCDMIQSVASAMRAGYSVENAFLESFGDMRMIHGQDAFICRELEVVRRGLVMNLTLEELLSDLGRRSHVAQIGEFAAVFAIARKSGGNMTEVISSSAQMIRRITETKEEILIQTAARRMERNIMIVMPFAIMTYVGAGNRGYFDTLYHNLPGAAIMTGCLVVYLAAYCLSDRILDRALAVGE